MTAVRLIISVDGTTNTQYGSLDTVKGTINGVVTSVKRIHDMSKVGSVTDASGKVYQQDPQYFQGVGTVDVDNDIIQNNLNLFLRPRAIFQGLTGSGYLDILRSAYKTCCLKLPGVNDEIWMFGFSRGAFIVRALASMLQHVGLIKPDEMLTDSAFTRRFNDQLQRYMLRTSVNAIVSLNRDSLLPFARKSPQIRFIGVFDTVKSVFPTILINTLNHQMPFIELEQDAPRLVQHFRHALAINEGRPHFSPTLWKSNAHSTNTDASFLEAWFFGYHTDVGGGNPRRGVALWPLQWMMSCAVEKGLVLDANHYKSSILFTGALTTVNMPHQPSMKMYDMMKHHAADGSYRLLLNETSSWAQFEPRNYGNSLTTPPYTGVINSRVFVHPSAYLQFNISSSFRIQLYEWKWFHSFVRNRLRAIPNGVPWWEAETEKNILMEILPLRQMRLLIFGAAGAGKLALINEAFGENNGGQLGVPVVPPTNIKTPMKITGNDLMEVHFSNGFPPGGTDTFGNVQTFISDFLSKTNIEDQLHAIWYCVDLMQSYVPSSRQNFSALRVGNIPIIVVLTKADEMRVEIRRKLTASGVTPTDENVENRLEEIIEEKRNEITGLVGRSFVPVGQSIDSVRNLLSVTFQNLEELRVQITEIRAQRASVRPKIAIAADQALRAYAIWREFSLKGNNIVFSRGPAGQRKLSEVLMQPILDIFNMKVPGGANLIQSRVGTPWKKDLDAFPMTLWDKKIPGDLILCCMVDTIIIMARSSILARPRSLRSADIESACTWYIPKQSAVHTRIRTLLTKDWLPVDKSMAVLQLGAIETIEFGLSTGSTLLEDAKDVVIGAGLSAVRGAASRTVNTLNVGSGIVFGTAHEIRRGFFG